MKELIELLQTLKSKGAPAKVVEELEMLIEKRALRIMRHEEEIREWAKQKDEQDKLKKEGGDELNFLLIMLLMLIMNSNRETDEFQFSDLFLSPDDGPVWNEAKQSKPQF